MKKLIEIRGDIIKVAKNLPARLRWIVVLASVLVALALSLVWNPRQTESQIGGYSQVTRLELGYVPGRQSLQARISLASGLSVTYEAANEQDFQALLKMAQIFAQHGNRMFVVVKDDKIQSFQVSIP
jgi:hypothetical protein